MSERRSSQRRGSGDRIAGVLVAARDAYVRKQGAEVLAWAEAARELGEGETPEGRRAMMIATRRVFTPNVLRVMVERAVRRPEEQNRAAAIMRWIGPEGLETMIDAICESESAAPKQFLHDALAAEASAYPLLVPLLASPRPHVVRHGAELLGRLGDRRAVDALAPLIEHPAERVRAATVQALAVFDEPAADELLRHSLRHVSPSTRIAVARAAAARDRQSLLPALLDGFDAEEESVVRKELAAAVARLGATGDLVAIALDRRRMFRWRGRRVEVRLDALSGLSAADTTESRRLLDRLVREGDSPIRDAADRALSVRRLAER